MVVSLSHINPATSKFEVSFLLVFCNGGIPLTWLHNPCRCPRGRKE